VACKARAAGGEVRHLTSCGISAHRVFQKGQAYPGLAMARAIGDLCAQTLGVTWDPEVQTGIDFSEEDTLIVASDGVWEKFEEDAVARCISEAADEKAAAVSLVQRSRALWPQAGDIDDITAVVVRPSQPSRDVTL